MPQMCEYGCDLLAEFLISEGELVCPKCAVEAIWAGSRVLKYDHCGFEVNPQGVLVPLGPLPEGTRYGIMEGRWFSMGGLVTPYPPQLMTYCRNAAQAGMSAARKRWARRGLDPQCVYMFEATSLSPRDERFPVGGW